MRTGGQIVVEHLCAEGVRHLFMVPGESFLGVLDALHGENRIAPIAARNESAASMMAEATGKLTGRAGVAIVTRGPGAANAVAGVYVAAQDSSPMVLLVGLPKRSVKALPAFQRVNLHKLFGGLAKHVAIADSAATLPQHLTFAFRAATSGRPGPVVLGLPEDVLTEAAKPGAPAQLGDLPDGVPDEEDLEHLGVLFAGAERPLIIAGAARWSQEAASALAKFAERHDIPVAAAFRRQDRLDNTHRCYSGHLGLKMNAVLADAVRAADLVVVLGDCLNEVTSGGFKLLKRNGGNQTLVLIDASAYHAEPPYEPDLAVNACPQRTIEDLAGRSHTVPATRNQWRRRLRQVYEASVHTTPRSSAIDVDAVIAHIRDIVPADTIMCSGAGNYAAAVHRSFQYRGYPSQLAPVSGSMGYGLPAAIAAALASPDKLVVAVAGDGCFQMTGAELMTAVQWQLPVITVVVNNSALGTIRTAQRSGGEGRLIATTLVNPDFAVLAAASGALGLRVTRTQDFADAFAKARAAQGPSLIELVL